MSKKTNQELAAEGYAEAVKFAIESAKGLWVIFSNMLAANSFLVVLISFVKLQHPEKTFLPIALGLCGLVLCASWYFLSIRMAKCNVYYYAVARHLEFIAYGDLVKIVRDGALYSNGSQVTVDNETLQMCGRGRSFKVQTLVNLVIFLFGCIYIYLGCQP